MDDKSQRRRKYAGVDLQQIVTRLDVYRRPLDNAIGGTSGAFGVVHEAAIVTTETGDLYLIEKGVSINEDVNHEVKYREGACRIAQVTKKDIRDWKLVKTVTQVKSGLTLEELFDKCGQGYSLLADNCWNSTQRMRVCANEAEDGLSWQAKGALIAGGAVLAVGLLAAVFGTQKESEKKKAQKQ